MILITLSTGYEQERNVLINYTLELETININNFPIAKTGN